MSIIKKISYIYAIGENGLIFSTSFGKKIDLKQTKPGSIVQNLYDKDFVLYNIYDNEYYLTSRGVKDVKNLDNFSKIQSKIIDLIKMFYSAPVSEIHQSSISGKSYFQNFIKHINDSLDKPIKLRKQKWSLSKYQQLYNEIVFELSHLSSKYENLNQLFDGVSVCFNALLYKNNILISTQGGVFPKIESDGSISDHNLKNALINIEMLAVLIANKPHKSSHDDLYIKELFEDLKL